MELERAQKEKTYRAEKQIAIVRAVIIVFGTITFFLLENPDINYRLSYIMLCLIWIYGAFILIFKPYEKYPVFHASWFSYVSDCIFATLWIYATGGFYSPYHVMYYTSIIAVAFRYGHRTTLLTSVLYTAAYFALLWYMNHLDTNLALATVRAGFIFIIGYFTSLITSETLSQTVQRLGMQKLMEEAQASHRALQQSQKELHDLNQTLKLRNDIFVHAEENAQLGTYAWYPDEGKLEYSDNLFRLLGHQPGDFEPSIEKYHEFVHPEERERFSRFISDVLAGEPTTSITNRVIMKDGTTRYMRGTVKITGGAERKMIIGTVQDVTHDIILQEKLQEKNLELERSNNELSSFNYIASHDLQEPVRKILTFSELVTQRETGLSDTATHHINRIKSAAQRMQHLIEAFLNYSRVEHTEIRLKDIDLNTVLEEVRVAMNDQLEENNARIEHGTLPVIKAVPFHMQQLFINLFSNSIKYSREGVDPLITLQAEEASAPPVSSTALADKRRYWKITIKDNGIGFEPEYAEKIFEVFQRLHTKDKYEGTGIGLAICKKIVQNHRGFIAAYGEPGKGATFTIYLPKEV